MYVYPREVEYDLAIVRAVTVATQHKLSFTHHELAWGSLLYTGLCGLSSSSCTEASSTTMRSDYQPACLQPPLDSCQCYSLAVALHFHSYLSSVQYKRTFNLRNVSILKFKSVQTSRHVHTRVQSSHTSMGLIHLLNATIIIQLSKKGSCVAGQ